MTRRLLQRFAHLGRRWIDRRKIAKGARRRRLALRLGLERLEPRQILSGVSDGGDAMVDRYDIDGNGNITSDDALAIIDVINSPHAPATTKPQPKYDINDDQSCTALDPLLVINFVNSPAEQAADGEGSMEPIAGPAEPVPGSLGDRVWNDLNRNGIQDPGEPGIAGVTVNLLDSAGNTVGTTITDAEGHYRFDVDLDAGGSGGALTVTAPAELARGFPLSADDPLSYISPDATSMLVTVWNGYPPHVGQRTWDPVQNRWNEYVDLLPPDSSYGCLSPEWLDGGTTMYYNRDPPGIYRSRWTENGWSGGERVIDAPAVVGAFNGKQIYFTHSYDDVYVADYNEETDQFSDPRPVDSINTSQWAEQAPWISSDGLLLIFHSNRPGGYGGHDLWYATRIAPGEEWTNITNIGPNVNSAESDVGAKLAEEGERLFFIREESPGNWRLMEATIARTFPGYRLEFVPPEGYLFSSQDQGTDDGLDSDADPATGLTPSITLFAGQTDNTWDAGMYELGKIRGTKWNDLNANGVRDEGEPGLLGWTMYVDENRNEQWDDGEPYAITDDNGDYVLSVAEGLVVDQAVPAPGFPNPTANELLTYISPDGQLMLTSWTYPGNVGRRVWEPQTGLWSDREQLQPTGTNHGYLSPDGSTMYLNYATPVGGEGNIYRSNWDGNRWSAPEPVPNVDTPTADHTPAFNGTQIYWTRLYDDIWVADYDPATGQFSNPRAVDSIDTSEWAEEYAWVSSDGRLLVFSSNRPGGYGGYDLWYATRNDPRDDWGHITNFGPNVNTGAGEGVGRIAEDVGLLFFNRDGAQGSQLMQAKVGYAVREVLQPGWAQTFPDNAHSHHIVMAPGQVVTSTDFGNHRPTAEAGGDYAGNEGSDIAIDGSASTDGANDIVSYEWDLDNDGEYDDAVGAAATFPTIDDGVYPIGLRVTDALGAWSLDTATVTVNNVAPEIIELTVDPVVVDEGGTVKLQGAIVEPSPSDTFTLEITWQPGVVEAVPLPAGAREFTLTHQYPDDDPGGTPWDCYDVQVVLTDDDGGAWQSPGELDPISVLVVNAAPEITPLVLSQPVIEQDGEVTVTGNFLDAGHLDVHTLLVDWGDGASESSELPVGARQFALTHRYDQPGDFSITVTVSDDDWGEDWQRAEITVLRVEYIGNHPLAHPAGWSFRDDDGDVVTPKWTGPGYGELVFGVDDDLQDIALFGTTVSTTLALRVRKGVEGDGCLDVSSLSADGGAGRLSLESVNVVGAGIETAGAVRNLALLDVFDGATLRFGGSLTDDLSVTARQLGNVALSFPGRLRSLTAQSWAGGTIDVGSAGTIRMTAGNLGADVVIDPGRNPNGGFQNIQLDAGDLTGRIDVPGHGGTVAVNGNIGPTEIHVGGGLDRLMVWDGDMHVTLRSQGPVGRIEATRGSLDLDLTVVGNVDRIVASAGNTTEGGEITGSFVVQANPALGQPGNLGLMSAVEIGLTRLEVSGSAVIKAKESKAIGGNPAWGGSVTSAEAMLVGGALTISAEGGSIQSPLIGAGGQTSLSAVASPSRSDTGNILAAIELVGGTGHRLSTSGGSIQLTSLLVDSGGLMLSASEARIGTTWYGGGIQIDGNATISGTTQLVAQGGDIMLGGQLTVHGDVSRISASRGRSGTGGRLGSATSGRQVDLAIEGELRLLEVDQLFADLDIASLVSGHLRKDKISGAPVADVHGTIRARNRNSGAVRGADRTIQLRNDDDGVIWAY